MAEFNAVDSQIINPGESFIFTSTPVPCRAGLIRHREGTGNFLLAGYSFVRRIYGMLFRSRTSPYLVIFGSNVAIPEGGTVAPISVSIALDGASIPASVMETTPAAVSQFSNIGRTITAEVWSGCCETITIKNTGTEPIEATGTTLSIVPNF